MTKRGFDIAFAIVMLILTAPLLCVVSLGIKLTSRGPVFYRCRRVGLDQVTFELIKFRSMHQGPSPSCVITSANDPRITSLGRLLRKTKIDELPQLVNVLCGHMSIVGPRPEDPKIVEQYYTNWMLRTLTVRPGLTGRGSIFYYQQGEDLIGHQNAEHFYAKTLLPAKLKLELDYMQRSSVLSDLVVIADTVAAIWKTCMQAKSRVLSRPTTGSSIR